VRLQTRISKELNKKIDAEVKQEGEGVTKSYIINRALKFYYDTLDATNQQLKEMYKEQCQK
jgi:hypothetical protein